VVELIEWDSRRSLGISEEAVLFLGLAVFTVVMAYNASYDPYFADIAAPTAFETLTLISILATVYFLWRGHDTWFFFFALLSYLCRPTGLMVLGLLGIAVPISAPSRCKALLRRVLAAIFIVLLFTQVYNNVYLPLIAGKLNLGIPFGGILKRYQYLRLDDWSRLNYILYPSGILPAFSLLAFRWQDALGRLIILVTVMYFLLFVVPAFVALHHFVPVMVLPLVAFWRLYLQRTERMPGLTLLAVAALGILSLWLSLPRHFELNRTLRSIGQRTELRIGDYETEYRSLVSRFRLLFRLIPPDWEVEDPNVELVSGYASLIYYATRQKSAGVQINYIVQPLEDPAPPGFTQAATDDVAALYVRDKQQWLRDRYQSLRTDFRSTLYDIPRSVLFRHWGVPRGEYTIDLLQLLPAGIAELILQHQGQ
jgi:hypothetical protein